MIIPFNIKIKSRKRIIVDIKLTISTPTPILCDRILIKIYKGSEEVKMAIDGNPKVAKP